MEEVKKNSEGIQHEEVKQEGHGTPDIFDICQRIPLEYSASSIQRNLIALTDHPEPKRNLPISCSVGFIHKGSFIIYHVEGENSHHINSNHKQSIHLTELIRLTTSSSCATNKISKGTVILQAKWLETTNGYVLLLGSINGIYFFDEDGVKHIGKFDNVLGLTGYSRASSSVGNSILAGTDSGDILCFEYDPARGTVSYTHQKEKLHLSSIQDMSKYQQMLASGDATGVIKVWRVQDFSIIGDFLAAEDCVTGCILSGNHVIGAYASGVVRIYDIKSKDMQVMIKAHSRWIVSMDINVRQSLLLTVSEDNTARLWRIREKSSDKSLSLEDLTTQPKMIYGVSIKNQVLVGGCFIDTQGTSFALSSYAEKQLMIYSAPI
ncbi:unnamed protein product [Allacma fusca]|uniref:WD repeat-containing protein 54 beta-propeller domain-containing protein n=1 Tax=Allacma fusca TaxID=39272 RepID=A0A8J2JJL9_9HEXA|nr:unnamed protein product [Allacma fusca]